MAKQMKAELDTLFTDDAKRRRTKEPIPRKVFAVRQIRGPLPHKDVVVRAVGGLDAQRQWFNYHNLASQTYRYNLSVVSVPEGHPSYGLAIECQNPRTPSEMSLNDQLDQQLADQQAMLGKVTQGVG